MNKTLSGRLGELKNKEKVQLGNPKWSRSLTGAFHHKATIQTGFNKGGLNKSSSLTRVVARRASTVLQYRRKPMTATSCLPQSAWKVWIYSYSEQRNDF